VTFDRFTATNGFVWPIEEAGEGPTVLALHGVGGGAYFFRGLAQRLSLRYRVIATDLPSGLRPDGSAEPATMAAWADGVSELLASRVTEPAVVVGHSLGTILALELWRRRPGLVRALAFVGGLPAVRDLMRDRLRERLVAVADQGMAGWGPRVASGVFGRKAFDAVPESIGMFERLLEAHPPATYIRNMEILLAASAVDVVPTVSVPCLSISGTEDNYAPPEFVADFLRMLPGSCDQVVLEGVGHMPFFEVPAEFAAAIGAFLARVDALRPPQGAAAPTS
jgi:pimeloyl-ACP methyl ester carboxylesterase